MGTLSGKIALVTGASRGIGKGIALALAEAGATVYITGRTVDAATAAVPLGGTIHETAAEASARGGAILPIRCDHSDDTQVAALFQRIAQEQGHLDILVNNAWRGYEGYSTGAAYPPDWPFWQKPHTYWDENMDGVRWAYVATWHALRMMLAPVEDPWGDPAQLAETYRQDRGGLIVNISVSVPNAGNPSYNIAKHAIDRLVWETAHLVGERPVTSVSIYPGLVRTESVLLNAQYFDMSTSESTEYTGRAVVALAADANVKQRDGKAFEVWRLANEYDFTDIDGTRPGGPMVRWTPPIV